MGRHRATNDGEKAARRHQILTATAGLLERWSLDDVNMDRIADHAGIAKGTVYLYFRTRDELVLELFDWQHGLWLEALEAEIRAMIEFPTADLISHATVSTLLQRPLLLRLFGRTTGLFRGSVSVETVRDIKRRQLRRIEAVASALDGKVSGLTRPRVEQWLLRLEAFIAGMTTLAQPPPAVAAALQWPDLAKLQIDLGSELQYIAVRMLLSSSEDLLS